MSPMEGPAEGMELPEIEPESEAMALVTPPVVARVTGSTGTNPLADGTFRAMLITWPGAVVGFTNLQWHWLTDDALAALVIVVAPAGVLLWALFDKFAKPRILSS